MNKKKSLIFAGLAMPLILAMFFLNVYSTGTGLSGALFRHLQSQMANWAETIEFFKNNRIPTSIVITPTLPPQNDIVDLPESLPAAPQLTESERLAQIQPEDVLEDPLNRVNQEFKIHGELKDRVRFWFGIYTQFNRNTHVIHHTLYPWITYEILDFNDAIANGKGPTWLRIDKSNKYAKLRAQQIRLALKKLSLNPSKKKTELEQMLVEKLRDLPGSRRKVYKVASEFLRTQLGQKDFFLGGLRRSTKYLPYMEETFSDANLPVDLTRMPFVESSFNEQAESKVGASGIWQVMPATGRSYGLVTEAIDERNSPLKATKMASRLLRSYHRALGSWPLAITAYNHGIGNIEKAIKAAKTRELHEIIDRYHQGDFKFASSNFFTCFLAALYAERYSEVVFPSFAREPALSHERFVITKGNLRLKHLISQGGLNLNDIVIQNLDLNRKLIHQIQLPQGFVLHLPPGTSTYLPERLRSKMRALPTQPGNITDQRIIEKETKGS